LNATATGSLLPCNRAIVAVYGLWPFMASFDQPWWLLSFPRKMNAGRKTHY
jgi:hypothetical protein